MRKRKSLLLIISMVLLVCACGKSEVPSQKEDAEEVVQENAEADVAEDVKTTDAATMQEEIQEPTPEPTIQPTAEPTSEPIVYEGIDMESTLPGKEWISTFEGIIDEPKFVVYNDETNKKVIVENGQEVEFSQGDILVVYTLKGKTLGTYDGKHIESIVGYNISYNEIVFREVRKVAPNTISVDIVNEDNYVIQELTCKLKAPTN